MQHLPVRSARAAFTLVELAIVLVIIGLIIGGVLVGQDMVKGAEGRATAGQFEKYNSAVNAFRDKYRQVPGDLNPVQAAQFGFLTRTGGVAGQGDSNGLLEGCSSAATILGCETVMVWEDLSSANLLDGSFSVAYSSTPPTLTLSTIPTMLPIARMGRGNFFSIYVSGSYNYYQLGGIAAITAGVPTLTKTITPQESYNIDSKLDDGKPATGSMTAVDGDATAFNSFPSDAGTTAGSCIDATGSTGAYQKSTAALANSPACALRARMN